MNDQLSIQSEDDVYYALAFVRQLMKDLSFSKMDQQMVLVSVSELTRNVLDHAGGKGEFFCEKIEGGLRIVVMDHGPGIPDVKAVLSGQAHSPRGLGLGLAGVQRLMDELHIETSARGTRIVAKKWGRRGGSHAEQIGFHR